MHNVTRVWVAGCLAMIATAGSTVFNGILAVNNSSNDKLLQSLRVLLYVGLGFSFLGFLSLIYFTAFYASSVKSQSLHLSTAIWSTLATGVVVGVGGLALPLVPLIWLTLEEKNLPREILDHDPLVWLVVWYCCWGIALLLQTTLFTILALWTNQKLKTQSAGRLDIDFGTRLPPSPKDGMPSEYRSCHSRDTTIADPPSTSDTQRPGSSHYAASTKVPAPSSRAPSINMNQSAKSSFDIAFPAGEAMSIDNAFDRWDTSAVHFEMRAAVGSPIIVPTTLETIPGSRPESPEDAVDESFLPSSPPKMSSSSPKAITSDTATAIGDWSSSPSRYAANSSPPSSPPNFSRPTSKQKNQPLTASFETSMQEIIHPLFRASSPHPPPIATAGTMVTASPLANQPITPRTLANLRNHNKSLSAANHQSSKSIGHWRAMPSISQTSERRPSTSGSLGPSSPPPGSPGPSIADEEELPPILPGFVLSAGQRTSMLGYANRKSIKKDRRGSQMSSVV